MHIACPIQTRLRTRWTYDSANEVIAGHRLILMLVDPVTLLTLTFDLLIPKHGKVW